MMSLLRHEWRQVRAGDTPLATAVVFLFAVVAVLAFGIGADLPILARTGPGALWVATLLSSLLGSDRFVAGDVEDGTLDTLRTSDLSLMSYAMAKVIARWAFVTLPVAIIAPFAGFLLAMAPQTIFAAAGTLLIGSLALASISTLAAALAGLTRGGAVLGPVLVLPLLVPVVIFGAGAASLWSQPGFATPFLLLCASTLASLAVTLLAVPFLLRSHR